MLKLVSDIEFHCVTITVREFGTVGKYDWGKMCNLSEALEM